MIKEQLYLISQEFLCGFQQSSRIAINLYRQLYQLTEPYIKKLEFITETYPIKIVWLCCTNSQNCSHRYGSPSFSSYTRLIFKEWNITCFKSSCVVELPVHRVADLVRTDCLGWILMIPKTWICYSSVLFALLT